MDRDRDISRTDTETEVDRRTEEDAGEMVGQGVGGAGGAVAGGALGSMAGPVGTIIGGIAGAVGGWWAGEKVAEAVEDMSEDDEKHFRQHYESTDRGVPEYEDARAGYVVGSTAARHPGYGDSEFEDIEADLRNGFLTRDEDWDYSYDEMRPYIHEGYSHSRGRMRSRARNP